MLRSWSRSQKKKKEQKKKNIFLAVDMVVKKQILTRRSLTLNISKACFTGLDGVLHNLVEGVCFENLYVILAARQCIASRASKLFLFGQPS